MGKGTLEMLLLLLLLLLLLSLLLLLLLLKVANGKQVNFPYKPPVFALEIENTNRLKVSPERLEQLQHCTAQGEPLQT